jgi:CRISPR-associated endonuclease Csn1
MAKTLGLDIGTNSVGWCIMENEKDIIDMGVRIFPVGVKEDDYAKSGTEISKNATRRQARGIRRLYDRYKIRRRNLKKTLIKLEMHPTEEMIIKITPSLLYGLRKKALNEKISLKEIGRIFLHLNQRRGFKSNKKEAKTEEEKKEKSETLKKMNELSLKVKESRCRTIGEYFCNLFDLNNNIKNWHNIEEPVERIRNRFVYRKLYEEEFEMIWDKQKQFYPDILNDINKKLIKNDCIFYQRPLKSQKHLVGKCRFEPKKRVSPRSSFDFQEFRIWQTLNNIRVTTDNRFRDLLTLEEKHKLAKQLMIKEKIGKNEIKNEILNLGSRTKFNDFPEKLNGNTTISKLRNSLGKEFFDKLDYKIKYKLWHTLFFANDEEWLLDYSIEKLGLSQEQAEKYLGIDLEPDYSNISVKAIRKIIPFLKEGYDYAKACELAGYHHSYNEETDSKDRKLNDKILRTKDDDLRNPLVMQSLSETYRLVNSIITEYGKPDKIRVEFARQLKWPKRKREEYKRKADQTRIRRDDYTDFLKEKGLLKFVAKSDILKFELWLELQFCEKELHKIKDNIDIVEFKKFAKNVKSSDNEKYKLYLECGRISPYTGKVISLKELFSPEIEIEHIIPYSKSMDDSFINKTLCEKKFNADVGKELKALWFKERPEERKEFIDRVKYFNDAKQEKFLTEVIPEDFLHSQLTNNAYIAKEARKKFKTICRDVYITNGQATSELRRLWNLNIILNPDGKNEKSRDDHRHHAIDALVIANTEQKYLQTLSTASNFDFKGKLSINNFPIPFDDFWFKAFQMLNGTFISYRNKKRLITTKKNKYIHSKKPLEQKTISIRGPLHEETLYGQITNPETGDSCYVIRKPVSSIETYKQIDKIVDKGIREIIKTHIENNGGEKQLKAAMKLPIYMISKDEKKKILIKTVRMIDPAENMIQLRPNENKKLFVSSGSNFCMAIYENPDTLKRDYETVTFYQAVKRKLSNQPIFPIEKNNKKLLVSLKQNELVVTYKNHMEEINWEDKKDIFDRLFRIIKFDVTGQIFLGRHNLAKIDLKKDRNLNLIQCRANTFKGVKIRITTTGKLIRV